jgi:hypothetical protein
MMYSRICLIIFFSIIASSNMTGCTEKPETIQWYMEHKAERDTKIQWCSDDTGRALSVDCMNAEKAVERVMLDSKVQTIDTFKFVPPVDNNR